MKQSLLDAMNQRILLFDGAMGTEIQKFNPEPKDFPDGKDGFNDGLILTHPEWIRKIHLEYLRAGADCIETNSFGSNKLKLDEYGFGDKTVEMNQKIAALAVDAAKEFSDKPRYVVGSMGPTG
ncbi:MAG TPA: homocysteine S-methyltransferase family protein, partial [Candidatus Nitrosotenuis sp.]|nr:homocysteine S-methyltransferase family protein [Candidatus Nitrosotenuis sp.]